ncbi:BTAD domain-containing putative transcriptional regulator [Streptomyces sp. NPDC048603]|uniref:AfsR/SARP family transcriptional regulator n=1 Tax=Streptomyces sp. NPDC048603 TaxID=3365577 RepID=UPI00371CEF0B
MRFEVLGPVTVRTEDGRPVAVPEAKVRALLADLLVHGGRPVAADRLIDDLWGENLPGNPGNTLQTKVSHLRRVLAAAEDGGRALVAHGPAGYALRAGAEALDVERFAGLTDRARAETDARERAALLGRALGLWRGEAYADFRDAAFAQAEIARLEEQRLTAHEDLAETRLQLGEHAALADELGALVVAHPLRGRIRGAHMRALYGAGRASEALESYADLRRRYADELGLDPEPELAELHAAMLRQDPALRRAAPDPSEGRAPGRSSDEAPDRAADRAAGPAGDGVGVAPEWAGTRPRTNLPASVSTLVGRQEAVDGVYALLDAGRLVTLTGPGGVGKTRLALEAAQRLLAGGGFPDGVWLVELAGTKGEVAETVAAALGIREEGPGQSGPPEAGFVHPESDLALAEPGSETAAYAGSTGPVTATRGGPLGAPPGRPAPDTLAEVLAEALAVRRALLVLDNCEHVLDAVAPLVGLLLRRAPGLRVLATSQEPLAVAGEVLHAVPPLAGAEAVELFAARAAAAAPGFTVTPDNHEAVALICRRLDGIPLALELAASRVRALGVHTLADRLHDRFRLLSQVRRDAPARQRTLRAVIDWSWELLPDAERAVLRRLAVFSGGFTLESAETVCAGTAEDGSGGSHDNDGSGGYDVPDLVARLVDRSLVVAAYEEGTGGGGGGDVRYRMLESVIAYGLERLDEAGETRTVRDRHARHHIGLAERAAAGLHGHGQRRWLAVLDAETPNLRAALDHVTGPARDPESGLRLGNALTWYWFLRGRLGEGVRSLDRALEAAGAADARAADPGAPGRTPDSGAAARTARAHRAAFTLLTGDDSRLAEAHDDAGPRSRWLLAYARCGFGEVPDGDAPDRLPEEFRQLGDRWGEAAAVGMLGTRAMYRGDLDGLRRHAGHSARLFGELGDQWGRLQASELLGVLAEIAGDYEAAARLHGEGVSGAQELEMWTHASFRLARQGRIALLTGDDAAATEFHERARRLAVEQSHRSAEQFAETGLALGARRRGDLDTAEALLRPWLAWNRRMRVDTGTALVLAQLGYVAEQRGDAERAEALHRQGLAAARRTGDPRALALAYEGLAGARSAGGRHEDAARLLGAAAALRESVGMPLPAAERADADRAAARARAALDEPAYAAAFARGRGPTPHLDLPDLPDLA